MGSLKYQELLGENIMPFMRNLGHHSKTNKQTNKTPEYYWAVGHHPFYFNI